MRIFPDPAVSVFRAIVALAGVALALSPGALPAQDYEAPLTPDGNPDLNGIWQALGTAHWNIEGHSAESGPVVEMGAIGAIPGGLGIVAGSEIPTRTGRSRRGTRTERTSSSWTRW